MANTFVCTAAIGAVFLVQAAAVSAQQMGTRSPETAPPIRIGAGDLLEVAVFDDSELSGRFRVDEKGDITVPLLGPVHVEGETAAEAGITIERRYVEAEILKSPNSLATVFITEYATQGIVVTGEVRSPGLYPALGVRMLSDVLNAAGGVLPTAALKLTITRKADPGNPITIDYNPDVPGAAAQAVQIFPGDTITVPIAGLVYVLGSVGHTGAFVLEGRHILTVEKALALAGGSIHGAKMSHAHIVRTLDGGKKEDIDFNANDVLKGKAPDMALKDGDILYIPTSNAKLALMQAINSAIGVGTSVLTYRTAYQ